ncbi:MAG: AAA family ATPase [Acidimicrobiales bacterium]
MTADLDQLAEVAGQQLSPHFVGIGIDTYEHDPPFGRLEALADIEAIAGLLSGSRGFVTVVHGDLLAPEALQKVQRALPSAALAGCALMVMWAGHGEQSATGTLRLITGDAYPNVNPSVTAEWLAAQAVYTGASQVLLVLDTCYAGQAIIDAAGLVARLKANLGEPKPVWVGILASAQAYEQARDGLFAAALRRVLEKGPNDPVLLLRFNAFNEGVRGDDVIDAVVQEWTASTQRPESATQGRPGVLLPNPLYDPNAPERVVEHLLLAAQGRAPDEEGSYFTGRDEQLAEIVAWMGRYEPGVLVITGPAGSGKSAIAGRIVSLSNPAERATLVASGPVDHDPGEGSVHAHVHARRLTVDRVAELLDEQLRRRNVLPPATERRSRHELLGAIGRVGERLTIVIDGLDEAEQEAWSIADDLVRELGRTCRVLTATREMDRQGAPSLVATLGTMVPLDLGDPKWFAQTEANVRDYVLRRLAAVGEASAWMDPALVADHIAGMAQGNVDEGLFLLARVITSQLRSDPVDTTEPGWETSLVTSIEDALHRDLGRIADAAPSGAPGPIAARELLTALAWGYGSGLPDDAWPAIATALSTIGVTYRRPDVYWALVVAGRYVVAADGGGRAAYRLSHQRLVRYLRPQRRPAERLERDPGALAVSSAIRALFDEVVAAGDDPVSHRYLWLHAWRHCADAGMPGIEHLRTIAEWSAAFVPDLAMALNNLGIRYAEVGRRGEAVAPTEEAVALYRALAADNDAFVPDLAMALNNLGIRYAEVGRRGEIDAAWEAALAALRTKPARVDALLARARARQEAGDAIADLRRAGALLVAGDVALEGRLHAAARSCRTLSAAAFDAAWQIANGDQPDWLTLDPADLDRVTGWVRTATYEQAFAFAGEHGPALLAGQTELALTELGLLVGNPGATSEERSILDEARRSGFEVAYRLFLRRELVIAFLRGDPATQIGLLVDRRAELLDIEPEVVDSVIEPGVATNQSGAALLTLAGQDLDQRTAAAVTAISPVELASLTDDLVRDGNAGALLAVSQVAASLASGDQALAGAYLYASVASTLAGDPARAADLLRSARRIHQETVTGLVPTLLTWTARRPELAVLASVLGEALFPGEAEDEPEED